MAALAWLLIPLLAAIGAGLWGSWASRNRKTAGDGIELDGYARFRAAMERPEAVGRYEVVERPGITKTSVAVTKTSVAVTKTSAAATKTSAAVGKASMAVTKTPVVVVKTPVAVAKTSVALEKSSSDVV
ncbi:hypothetical protein ACFWFF_31515 [Streptomyces sp. NPDC060223]|uniref:hypothetical protein n=1 Tax=unclassified Streptomyces TaxID=2593676 RepID=UPI00363A340D